MSRTFLCPNTCGFGKIITLELSREVPKSLPRSKGEGITKYKARVFHKEYKQFLSVFALTASNFEIEYAKFVKRLPSLKETFNNWSRVKLHDKKKNLETFSR